MKEGSEKIKELLKNAGFLDKEIEVYLAILEMGKGTVAEISRKAGINRSTGYVILDSLAGRGLVSISGKEPKQEYAAEDPEQLSFFLKKKLQEQQELISSAEELLPELTTIYKKGDRPRVRFYEGKEGLKQVYENTLTATEDIYACSTYENMHSVLPNYFPQYYQRRAKKKIFAHAIVPETPLAHERRTKDTEEMREIAFIPPDTFLIPTEIDVYDNKVMIASWREKLGVIIESQEIADTLKSIFKLAWAEAKRLDEEKK